MAARQRWGWDHDEMRNAGRMAEDTPRLVPPGETPAISGFTPINRPQALINLCTGTGPETQSGRKLTRGKCPASNDLKVDARNRKGPTTSKSVISKKPKSAHTNGYSKKKNISKDLRRTKPGLKSPAIPLDRKTDSLSTESFTKLNTGFKLPSSCNQTPLEDDEDNTSNLVANTGEDLYASRHISLTERYQAEYNLKNVRDIVDLTVSRTYQKSPDGKDAPVFEELEGIEQADSLRCVNRNDDQFLSAGQPSLFWHSDTLQEFEPPQSAQTPTVDLEDCNSFDIDDTSGSDLDRVAICETYFEQVKPETTENTVIDDKFLNELDEWPDDVSMPDAVTVYDEELEENSNTVSQYAGAEDSQPSEALQPASGNIDRAVRPRKCHPNGSENEFDDSDLESSLVNLRLPTGTHQSSTPHTSPLPSSSPKLKWLPPKIFTPSKDLDKVPVMAQTMPHIVPKNAAGIHQPFVRPPFPKPIRDRSPILGLINTTVLRTCFRIGEALNAAAQASRSKTDAVVELYARVIASTREANNGFKQSFQFADLFSDKPPFLSGTSTIWKGVGLWDQDSRVFLGEAGKGKMCRAVGRIKKGESQQGGCGMTVLSIWEVDWEEVGVAKGIACS